MSHNPAPVLITNVPERSYEPLLKTINLDMYVRSLAHAESGRNNANDLLSPGDLEELRAERSSEEVETILEGLSGSSVMHRLVTEYLAGLELYHQGLQAVPVTEFIKR